MLETKNSIIIRALIKSDESIGKGFTVIKATSKSR